MEPIYEIRRLYDVMPASARMTIKIISKPELPKVVDAAYPLPGRQEKPIYINFEFWNRLQEGERDLLLLRTVSLITAVKWLKPDIYQGAVVAGLLGSLVEFAQSDAVGVVVGVGLTVTAAMRVWRINTSQEAELNADSNAIQVALRRGYTETTAAQHLLDAIQQVAKLEKRPTLSFVELIRSQNLQAIIKF